MFKKIQGLVAGGKKLFDLAKGQGDKGSKVSTTIVGTTPKVGSLTKRRMDTDEIFRARQRHGVPPNKKTGETVKKVSKLNDEIDVIRNKTSKAKGGRIGYKKGTGLMKKKSNVEKIKETFATKKDTQSKMTKKKKKFPDLTGDGKVTFADVLKGRGVINGKNKNKNKRFV